MTLNKGFGRVIFCDASDVGFGVFISYYLDSHLESIETFSNWNKSERLDTSTWRELEYVTRGIYTFYNELENKQVKINSHNKNVEHILKVHVGSKKTTLRKTAIQIHSICEYSVDILLDSKNKKPIMLIC